MYAGGGGDGGDDGDDGDGALYAGKAMRRVLEVVENLRCTYDDATSKCWVQRIKWR